MKLVHTLLVTAALVGSPLTAGVAEAAMVTGTISISGNDTYDATKITFNPSTGVIYQASGTMSTFAPVMVGGLSASYTANLTSFQFASAAGTQVFNATNNLGQTLSFTIQALNSSGIDRFGSLSVYGSGYFNQTGYDQTLGQFSLTSSTSGTITGFQLVSSVGSVPEPATWAMMILGMGAVGYAIRRRQKAATWAASAA